MGLPSCVANGLAGIELDRKSRKSKDYGTDGRIVARDFVRIAKNQ